MAAYSCLLSSAELRERLGERHEDPQDGHGVQAGNRHHHEHAQLQTRARERGRGQVTKRKEAGRKDGGKWPDEGGQVISLP